MPHITKRIPIQIACLPKTIDSCASIVALCNDGTLWVSNDTNDNNWIQLLSIPQPENNDAN